MMIRHLQYWLGDMIGIICPDLSGVTTALITPPYYEHVGLVLADLMASDYLNDSSIRQLNNKMIYRELMAGLEPPKIVRESIQNYVPVWRRIHGGIIRGSSLETCYLLVHNKLPVTERLFRIKLRQDPYCSECDGAQVADTLHYFCGIMAVGERKSEFNGWNAG